MKKKAKYDTTSIRKNDTTEGESLESKIARRINNQERLDEDTVPLIYTERKDGVKAGYDIRTDRFEIALDATDVINRSRNARREERDKKDGGAEPTQDTPMEVVK